MTAELEILVDDETLVAFIPSRRNGCGTGFLGVFFVGGTIALAAGVVIMLRDSNGSAAHIVGAIGFAILWGVALLSIGFNALRAAVGIEEIRLSAATLTRRDHVLGWERSTEWPASGIRQVRERAPSRLPGPFRFHRDMAVWSDPGGSVAFDHDGRTHTIGEGLTAEEAVRLAAAIRAYLERNGKRNSG